jgi:hypothetical protein
LVLNLGLNLNPSELDPSPVQSLGWMLVKFGLRFTNAANSQNLFEPFQTGRPFAQIKGPFWDQFCQIQEDSVVPYASDQNHPIRTS